MNSLSSVQISFPSLGPVKLPCGSRKPRGRRPEPSFRWRCNATGKLRFFNKNVALKIYKGTSPASIAQGLAADAIILTTDGELPIQYLSAGDRVITRDTGTSIVKSIRSATVTCRAIALAAGSLGHTRPDRDVILPADQQILIRDWRAQALFGGKQAMVPVSRLIDGQYVSDLGEVEMTLYQIEFDAPHVIYADGLEVFSTTPEIAPDPDQVEVVESINA